MLKKVRLHADTLTRFDRDGYGLGEIANCSQMFHIEIVIVPEFEQRVNNKSGGPREN